MFLIVVANIEVSWKWLCWKTDRHINDFVSAEILLSYQTGFSRNYIQTFALTGQDEDRKHNRKNAFDEQELKVI